MSRQFNDMDMLASIEHLTKEDLVELVKDIYVMPTKTIEDCIKSMGHAKIRILENIRQPHVVESYFNSLLGEVPPPDKESNDEQY